MGKNAMYNIGTTSYKWAPMDTQSTVHRREPMMNVSAASMGENAIDDIATIS